MNLFAAVAEPDVPADHWMSVVASLLVLMGVAALVMVGWDRMRDWAQNVRFAASTALAKAQLKAFERTPVPLIPVPPVVEQLVVQSAYPARHRAEGGPDDPTRVLAVCPQVRAEAERLVAGVARKPMNAPHLQTRADGSVRA